MINQYIIQRRLKELYTEETIEPRKIPGIKALPVKEKAKIEERYFMDVLRISRPPKTRVFTITTTPVLILRPPHEWPYLISNPALVTGLTTTVQLYSGTVSAEGNTQGSPLGVANYLNLHLHLNVTSVTGSWDIVGQTRDPTSGNWADSQVIFSDISSTGTYYATVGDYGIVTDFAIRWVPTAAGSITFSITATTKYGLGGASTGVARTVFIGGRDVTTDTGLPVFEGEDKIIYLGPDVELWAVSYVNTTLKVFTL